MRIRKLAPTEVLVFIELIRLFKRVFQTEPPGIQPSSELAKLLSSESFLNDIFVQADRVDDHALAFYRKTLPDGEAEVIHFNYESTGRP